MQKLILLLLLSYQPFRAAAQLSLQWQNALGGNFYESADDIQQTSDGGYIAVGFTFSENNGDVSTVNGGGDVWVVKLDEAGEIQWQKALGGSSTDIGHAIKQTSDGGYILAGQTSSDDGDVVGFHGGTLDYWVVKLDETGEIQWQNTLGGSGYEEAHDVLQTSDGGYIVAGFSSSNDGDVSGNHGQYDGWLVKLNAMGALQWQIALGSGTGSDVALSVLQTADNGYMLAGSTTSTDAGLANHGGEDFWVAKTDSTGHLEWQKAYGGESIELAKSIAQTKDGGFIVTGQSDSINSGDVTGGNGDFDIWVVKISATGQLAWQKTLGGSNFDYGESIQQTTDGGYILAGATRSTDGDVLGNNGAEDYWVLKLDGTGEIIRQITLGGTKSESANAIQQTSDGGFIVAGTTTSTDGYVTDSHGKDEMWVVKLSGFPVGVKEEPLFEPLEISPNPADQFIFVKTAANESILDVGIYDLTGRSVMRQTTKDGTLDVKLLAKGAYLIIASAPSGKKYHTIIYKQ